MVRHRSGSLWAGRQVGWTANAGRIVDGMDWRSSLGVQMLIGSDSQAPLPAESNLPQGIRPCSWVIATASWADWLGTCSIGVAVG